MEIPDNFAMWLPRADLIKSVITSLDAITQIYCVVIIYGYEVQGYKGKFAEDFAEQVTASMIK